MLPFFTENKFLQYKKALKAFCDDNKYYDLNLTNKEIEQLYWLMDNTFVTPEAYRDDVFENLPADIKAIVQERMQKRKMEDPSSIVFKDLDFEIMRGITRRYSFELLKRGNEQAYQKFVEGQNEAIRLPFEEFTKLAEEVQKLDPDIQKVIEVSCYLTKSLNARIVLLTKNISFSNDSEVFLTELADIVKTEKDLFPITQELTHKQIALLKKIYWPNMHMRHMIYTEGSEAMVSTFKEGIMTSNFSAEDFIAWKWRWLTNLMGFQSGPGAKYYTIETHQLAHIIIKYLDEMFSDPSIIFLDKYLKQRADLAGFSDPELNLSPPEQALLAHIAAYFNQVNILNKKLGAAIYQGYRYFLQSSNNSLASLYANYYPDVTVVTPTYVPAVINTAYEFFKKQFNQIEPALAHATEFMCQFLNQLYQLPRDQLISCMNIAQRSTLTPILEQWLEKRSLQIALDKNFNVIENTATNQNIKQLKM